MPVENNKNLTNASSIQKNNTEVNTLLTNELNQFRPMKDISEMMGIMQEPFELSDMKKGTVMGGGYQLEVNTLYRNQSYKNKNFIFDEFTLKNISDEDKQHLYVNNGIYATSKSRLLEIAKHYTEENHYDRYAFANTGEQYNMHSAKFDFFYKGDKLATQTLELNTQDVIRHRKSDLRGFIGYDVDIDNVNAERAKNLIEDINDGVVPTPTMVVVTGTGVHLKYIFTSPMAITNNTVLQKYQTMQGLFSRKFTHDPRYCGKEQETGSYQRDLPIGQLMRAVGNVYDKYNDCSILTTGYTSGVYSDINTLNEWADIPEIEISRKSPAIAYDNAKARKLSAREYQRLYDTFLTEGVGNRTRHRNALFYHMLIEGCMSFDEALVQINIMINELNERFPVQGNPVRLLTVNEARKFDPNSPECDVKYCNKYLSTSAIVDTIMYKSNIKQERYRTGLSQSENMKMVNKGTVHNIGLRSECLLYAIINTLNNDRGNKSGVANYNGQQCIIGNYDFTPFVLAHTNTYNIGEDILQRPVKRSYEVIDNPDAERSKTILTRVFEYLNGTLIQRVGSTDIYSNRQQLIHRLLLASTPQGTRDEFYNRYTGVAVPIRYTVQSEELYREINTYFNILLSLSHHHFNKIREGVKAEHAYITGNVLTENYNKVNETLLRIKGLLDLFNVKREAVIKSGVSTNVINAIYATNRKSLALAQQIEQELLASQLHDMLINFNGKRMPLQERLDKYEQILNFVSINNIELSFDNTYQLWHGISALGSQAKAHNELFITEINRRWSRLQALAPTILATDNLIRRFIHKGKGNKTRLHGTFMYVCYLRKHLGFLDMLPVDVSFPFTKAYKYIGIELTKIGRELLEYNNDNSYAMRMYPTFDPRTGSKRYAYKEFTDRGYMIALAKYYRISGKYRSDEEVMRLAKNLMSQFNGKNLSAESGVRLLERLKKETISYLNDLKLMGKSEDNSEYVIFEDTTDGDTNISETVITKTDLVGENLWT